MSLFTIAFFNNNQHIAMAADSRGSCIIDNITYQMTDNNTKLYKRDDGLVFYCSGVLDMSNEVAEKILSTKPEYLHRATVLEILETTYTKHIEMNPEIKNIKHSLQLAIPIKIERKWEVHVFDSENLFDPYSFQPEGDEIYVFSLGLGLHTAQPILEKLLNPIDKAEKVEVFDSFMEAYEAASSETCGGVMTYIALLGDGSVIERKEIIKDNKPIRRYKDRFNDHPQHGAGDGAITNPDGSAKSGTANISKPNGGWHFTYYNSNFARERRLKFEDEGILLSTETGSLEIKHDNGTFIRINNNGDIEVKAKGKVFFSGEGYDFK